MVEQEGSLTSAPQNCEKLLQDFLESEHPQKGEILTFEVPNGKTVYNITAPFILGGKTYLAGRVESPESSFGSSIYDASTMFFTQRGGIWVQAEGTSTLPMEDPAIAKIGNVFVVSGVEANPATQAIKTVFYQGPDLVGLKRFAEGPAGMKDIRLIQMPDGTISAFTRPENEVHDLWVKEIGFIKLASLDELNAQNLSHARVISGLFAPGEWGGTNEIHLLENGLLGVLGHIAYRGEKGNLHYFAMAFTFDPEKREASPLKIIATRQNFPQGEMEQGSTKAHVKDVVFPGGLIRNKEIGTAYLYAGLSDTMAGRIVTPDPFAIAM